MMNKRTRTSVESSVVNVWKRELGQLSNRNFAHRLAASEDTVLRLDLLRKLDKHRGCVNTVSFNASGDILVSGSDDRRIIIWDWETGHVKLSFHSGHHNNVFQAKFMPYTDDRSIVTCAADGHVICFSCSLICSKYHWMVRLAQLLECGKVETKLLAKHQGRAHKLAVEPGSPRIFYTCGEDGLVQHIDLRSGTATRLFTCKPLQNETYLSTVHLNAIAIDPRNPNYFVVGGSDQFARLYDIRKYNWNSSADLDQPVNFFCPEHLLDDEHVGITGLAFSNQSELLVSYSNEFIYLFTRDNGLGPDPPFTKVSAESDTDTSTPSNSNAKIESAPQAFKGHINCETVKGVNFFGPKCDYVVSGSDCGRIFIWKKKGGELVRVMEADNHVVNCIQSHPHIPVLASSGIEHDIKIWVPKAIDRAILPTNIQKRRPRSRGWMHHMVSPEDMVLQLFSLQSRRRMSPETSYGGDDSNTTGRDLLELLLSFNGNIDDSDDEEEDDGGGGSLRDDASAEDECSV